MRARASLVASALAAVALVAGCGSTLATRSAARPPDGTGTEARPVTFTLLHTNDLHGQLQATGSNPGLARLAAVVNEVRGARGPGSVLLVDAGDEMQGSLLSNLRRGAPTIATLNALGLSVATFGNHDLEWGREVLVARTREAAWPFVSANIVLDETGDCSTAGWTTPPFARPWVVREVAGVRVGFVGVTTVDTPSVIVASAARGLCFRDPAESILRHRDALRREADVVVVLSHLGIGDDRAGGAAYGDQTLARRLIEAGMPVPLIIGGHSHTDLAATAPVVEVSGRPGTTTVVQAHYNGRQVGRADVTFDRATGQATVAWQKLVVAPRGPEDPAVKSVVDGWANDTTFLALVHQPIGWSAVDLPRGDGTADAMMATFVGDAIYGQLNSDGDPSNDVDVVFNNAGGLRADWCLDRATSIWSSTGCQAGLHAPVLLTYGNLYGVLPFGNALVVGEMTGARIREVLEHGLSVGDGVLQPAGLRYRYRPRGTTDGGARAIPGVIDACVLDRATKACAPLDPARSYRVGTHEFLAPAGGDGYAGFRSMTSVTWWGDALDTVNAWVQARHGTPATAYRGPIGDGMLDGRIVPVEPARSAAAR